MTCSRVMVVGRRMGRSNNSWFHFNGLRSTETLFNKLVSMCCEAPVLAYADYSKPFLVHTDASLDGLGAVLYQEQEGTGRVIAYASRGLTPSERNYPVHKLEFLALKWAVTDKFHDYLYGNQFTVRTDNNYLTYVLTTAKLDAMGHCWVASLSCYNFDIVYRSGANNADADALSRITWPQKLQEVVSGSVVQALCHQVNTDYCTVESYGLDDEIVPDDLAASQLVGTVDWLKEQSANPAIVTVVQCITEGKPRPSGSGCSPELRSLLREKARLRVRNHLLYRIRTTGDQESPQTEFQLIIPPQCRKQPVKLVHDKAGHMGRERTLLLLRPKRFWPRMTTDVATHIRDCD